MADQVDVDDDAEEAAPVNGHAFARERARAERDAADRAAFLAGDYGGDEEEDEAPAKPAKPVAKKPAAPVEDDEDEGIQVNDVLDDEDEEDEETADLNDEDEEEDVEEDEDDLDDDDDDDEDEEEVVQAKDPDVEKRLAAVRRTAARQAERARRQVEQERAAWQAERARIEAADKPDREELEKFRGLKAVAKWNPAAVLEFFGYTEDDFEAASRELYARGKTAAADPKFRDAAAKMQRERQLAGEIDELKRWKIEREKTEKEREQHEAQRAQFAKTVEDIGAAAKKLGLPLAQKATPAQLAQVKLDLWNQRGTEPGPKACARAFEAMKRAELEAYGVKLDSVVAPTKSTGAKPVTKPGAKAPVVETKKKPPTRDRIVAELAALNAGKSGN